MEKGIVMSLHKSGCLICGKELKYFFTPQKFACEICGKECDGDASCEQGHFVCDRCHARPGYESIDALALKTPDRDPLAIARRMMANGFINMHGPEHHYLVVAALLAAYKNAGGDGVDLEKALAVARQRAEKVPGGVCGHWGACGAGIGTGIFISLVTGASPMSAAEWGLANKMTSLSLEAISQGGGPRCCKRGVWLAVLTAADFARDRLGVDMAVSGLPRCMFSGGNPSCRKAACLFHPQAAGE